MNGLTWIQIRVFGDPTTPKRTEFYGESRPDICFWPRPCVCYEKRVLFIKMLLNKSLEYRFKIVMTESRIETAIFKYLIILNIVSYKLSKNSVYFVLLKS